MDAQLRLKPGDAILTRGHARCGQEFLPNPAGPQQVSVSTFGVPKSKRVTGIKDRRPPKHCRHLPNDDVVQWPAGMLRTT